jgi:hypothetical protein
MSADHTYTAAGPVEGIFIETSHEFWGIPIPENIDDDPRYEGLLLLEPREMYDKCIVGVVRRFNDRFVLYNQDCVLGAMAESMIPDGGDAWTEAVEFFEYNTIGAWVGEHTPGFLEGEDE